MTFTHLNIPVKPDVGAIEAMIEASLDNQNNVEAIYKAIIDHYRGTHLHFARGASEDEIMKITVSTAKMTATETPFVTVTAYYGPSLTPATGLLTVETAFGLGKDLIAKACAVKDGL